jgi:dsRNA-specific ribonuclease
MDATAREITTKPFLNKTATFVGLDAYVLHSPRQKRPTDSLNILKYVPPAIIAAVWIDAGKDLDIVRQVARALGQVKSLRHIPSFLIHSRLFSGWESTPTPENFAQAGYVA